MQVLIDKVVIENGYLYDPIILIPTNGSRRTYISRDGIVFLKSLETLEEQIHPLSEDGLKICLFLIAEGIMKEIPTRFGLHYTFVVPHEKIIANLVNNIETKLAETERERNHG